MTDDKKPLIQDEDRSTQGGPQSGIAFMIILGSVVLIGIVAMVILIAT